MTASQKTQAPVNRKAKIETGVLFSVKNLKRALDPLFSTINPSTVLPTLETIRIYSDPEGITKAEATDLETCISTVFYPGVLNDVDHAISGKALSSFLKTALDDTCSLRFSDSNIVALRSGEFEVKVRGHDPQNFPKLAQLDPETSFSHTFNAEEIMPLLKKALPFVSTDDLRPAMTGVYLNDWNKKLHVVATDAHRLFYPSVIDTPQAFKGCDVIIPRKTIRIACSVFKEGKVTISYDLKYVSFKNQVTEVLARRIDARYPDYPVVIPQYDSSFGINRKKLAAFLKAAVKYANKVTHQLVMNIRDTEVTIKGGDANFEFGFGGSLPITLHKTPVENTNLTFGVNGNFFIQQLDTCDDEYTIISYDPQKPSRAVIVDNNSIIMPLMLSDANFTIDDL